MATTETRSERLKRLREDKEMSLLTVANKVGVEKATVSKWENHKDGSPEIALDVFFKLADLYEIDPRELATGKANAIPTLSPARIALITAYGKLAEEVRAPLRALIETLATAANPRYAAWSKREGDKARRRDAVHET